MNARSVSLQAAIAIVAALSMFAPAMATIDFCTYANTGCTPTGQGFPLPDAWTPYWTTTTTYGTQLLTHTDLCNDQPPITVEPGVNIPQCQAATAGPNPPCPCPPTPEPIPIVLPTQLWYSTAFWDGNDGYILGGAIDVNGQETADITKFSRGMPQGPAFDPPYEPNAPGGEIGPAGSLPTARASQGLAYDAEGNMAYLFAGTNAGGLDNQIYSYNPASQTSDTFTCTLPRNFDKMAGAWADGAAYAFGGRYLEGNGDTVAFSLHTSNEIYKFDPATCTVSLNPFYMPGVPGTAGTPDGKRYEMTAVTVGSNVYLFGGFFMEDVAGTTPTEVNSGAYAYNPLCPTVNQPPQLPCTVAQCAIMKFTPATGIITMISSSFGALCGNLAGTFDGQYIYLFKGASAYRWDPTVPGLPVFAASLPTGMGNPLKANDYSKGGTQGVSALSTGCSAYLFGGRVDFNSPIVTSPPDGPISDKITWFGKCRPKAVLAATYGYSCPHYPIWFDARFSTEGEADLKKVTWSWGDATPNSSGWWFGHVPDWYDQYAFIPHTYTKEGNFVATVTIRDFTGLTTSASITVPVRSDGVCTMYGGTPHNAVHQTMADSESLDSDLDGVPDISDNCAGLANNDQNDWDGDGMGDACAPAPDDDVVVVTPPETPEVPVPDSDQDGVADARDNCLSLPNHDQSDMDTDLKGDVCDADIDGDGISNSGPPGAFLDNCPWYANPDQVDANGDGAGDECAFMQGSFAAPGASDPAAAGGEPTVPAALPWTAATTMAVLAAAATVALLMFGLRRTLRRP